MSVGQLRRGAVTARRRTTATAPFTPAALSGLSGWWRADDAGTTDGAAVTSWPDRSGNGNTLAATTAPTYTAAPTGFGGMPAVSFNGSSTAVTKVNPTGIPAAGPLTVIVVTNLPSRNGFMRAVDYSGNSAGWGAGQSSSSGALFTTYGVQDYQGTNFLAGGVTSFRYRLNGDNSMDMVRANRPDNDHITAGAGVKAGANQFSIGGKVTASAEYFGGYIAEVMVWNRALTDAECDKVARYVTDRYTLPLGSRYNASAPLTIPTPDATGNATHPDVVYVPAGWNGWQYWMAMTPYHATNATLENPCILVSSDGFTWQVPAGGSNPVVPAPSGATTSGPPNNSDTDLVFSPDGATLWLLYRVYSATADIVYAMSSTNGTSWTTPVEIFRTGTTACLSPAILWDATNSRYVIYSVNDTNVNAPTIERRTATTVTGTWSAPTTVTATFPSPTYDLGAWHLDASWRGSKIDLIISTGAKDTASTGQRYLRWAASTDGLNFTVGKYPMLMPTGTRFDNTQIYRTAGFPSDDGTAMRLWYASQGATADWDIAYTTVPMTDAPL